MSIEESKKADISEDIIREKDKDISAFIEIFYDEYENGKEEGMLSGVPVAIKDNILIEGRHASAGSKMLESYIAPYDATVIKNLKKEGARFVGRTNMDEFAMGSSTEHSGYQITKNPVDTERVPGGSSGGSAASVSAGIVPVALGSDTGGSIRQPASYCGVVGLKPTYGSVSRYGLIAMGSSFDQIGPLTTNVADAQTMFSLLRGHDPRDATSVVRQEYKEAPQNLRLGVPAYLSELEGVDPEIERRFQESIDALSKSGVEIVEVDLPTAKDALAIYYIIMPAEASTNLARFDGMRYGHTASGEDLLAEYIQTRSTGFGDEAKRRIMLGTYVLSSGYHDAYYKQATQLRKVLIKEFSDVFSRADAIATPTTPTPAFRIGEKEDPLSMYLTDVFTMPANLTGTPAISVPNGRVLYEGKELPSGIQFISPWFCEETLFSLGKKVESIYAG